MRIYLYCFCIYLTVVNVELVNAVAGGELGVSFDLYKLSSSLSQYSPNYEPEVAPGLYFELPETGVTVMVFSSGNYHLTGGDSIEQIYQANSDLLDIVEDELEEEINPPDPEIRNLVYRGEFDMEFDLKELACDLPDSFIYHPEGQPGLKYRSDKFSGLITVFRTGSFTVTGAKLKKDADGLVKEFESHLSTLMSK